MRANEKKKNNLLQNNTKCFVTKWLYPKTKNPTRYIYMSPRQGENVLLNLNVTYIPT